MHPLRSFLPILCLMLALSGSSPLLAQISLSITVGPPHRIPDRRPEPGRPAPTRRSDEAMNKDHFILVKESAP
jgi:hypothetical protein